MPRKSRILIVDDSKIIRKEIENLLSDYNVEIVGTAGDGVEAIDLFKKTEPDLVTLDITMPEMEGTYVLKEILKINPSAIVIIITGIDDKMLGIECIRNGAKDLILKPFTPDMIKNAFSKYL